MDKPEWEFNEAPERVDLSRIREELRGAVGIEVYSYVGRLRINAPKTYQLFRHYCYKEHRGLWQAVNWHEEDCDPRCVEQHQGNLAQP